MSDSTSRTPSSALLTRSLAVTVPPTALTLRRAMVAASASDSSFLFSLCRAILPSSFLMMPSFPYTPQPPALADLRLEPETTTTSRIPTSPSNKPTGQRRSGRLLSGQNLILTSLMWSLAIVTLVDAQPAPCAKTHPFVGFRGKFTPELGTVEILDDCTFAHETFVGFNNRSIRGLIWGGQFQDSLGNLQRMGAVSGSVVSGSDFAVPYRLLPGLTWRAIDFLTVQSVAGEIVAAAPLGRPQAPQAPPTTRPQAPPAPITTQTVPPRTTTRTVPTTAIATIAPTATATSTPRTIEISPPGASTFVGTPTNGTSLPLKTPVPTITDPASPLIVRVGPNLNYPGLTPTVLNVSLWINETESPVLLLTRGKRYTFSIQAGTAHPVYITSSREGGKRNVVNSTEVIVAGNLTTFGTISAPLVWDFVAPLKGEVVGLNDTAALYYQCYVHRRMGWRIIFQDDNSTVDDSAASNANVAPRSIGPIALGALAVATALLMF